MPAQIFLKANNASANLSVAITSGSTSITVSGGHTLPAIAGSFRAVIWDIVHYQTPFIDPNVEILTVTYSGTPNQYNILRAQENTIAAAHPVNSQVAMTFTAGTATNDLFILGTHVLDETNIGPGYYIWFNAATQNYELHAGSSGSSTLPFGIFSSRPGSPVIGDWYLSIDTKMLYTCYTNGVWEIAGLPDQSGNSGKFLTTNGTVASWLNNSIGNYYVAGAGTTLLVSLDTTRTWTPGGTRNTTQQILKSFIVPEGVSGSLIAKYTITGYSGDDTPTTGVSKNGSTQTSSTATTGTITSSAITITAGDIISFWAYFATGSGADVVGIQNARLYYDYIWPTAPMTPTTGVDANL
jgi:hypothetical protein